MNILEHDSSDGKFYHEYNSRGISPRGVCRTGRSDDDIHLGTATSSSSSSSNISTSNSVVHTGFNGFHHHQQQEETCPSPTKLGCDNNSSCEVNESNSSSNSGTSNEHTDKVELDHPRMEQSESNNIIADGISVFIKEEGIDKEIIDDDPSTSAIFTCENCGRVEYKNEEFETIKLGDIFTQFTQFPSSSEGSHEGPRLCAQCLSNSHILAGSSSTHTQHNNIYQDNVSVINNNLSISNNNIINNHNHRSSGNHDTVVAVTNTSSDSSTINTIHNSSGSSDKSDGEGSDQLLQGVPTIIMQNSTNHLPSSHEPQYQQHYQQQHQYSIEQKQLEIPSPASHSHIPQEMHHDHQQEHFYQQGHLLQQIKLESDTMGHLQQPQQIKLEPDSMGHSQQQPQHPHDGSAEFMLIHDVAGGGGMYPSGGDESLQHLQHPTMVSFHQQQQPDNHLQPQQQHRQQVICDNQQQQHQSAIQQIAVVTPASDIKYTTLPTAVMQIQGKDQGGEVDQGHGSGGQQNHLDGLSQQQAPAAVTLTFSAPPGASVAPSNFQFLDLTALENSAKESTATATTTMITTVVTHTASSSSIVTTPASTITTTSTNTLNSKSSGNKSRSNNTNNNNNKSNNGNSAASSSAGGATNKKKNNNTHPQQPAEKIPCDLCKKKFKNPKMAMNHYKRVHEKEARFVCEICGAVFSYRGSLDSHLASHKPPEKTWDCEKCGMKFGVKANLRQHMRIHSDNPKKFPCQFCTSGFSKRVNLRYHIKRKHPEEAEKMNNNNNSDNKDGGIIASAITGAITNSVNLASSGAMSSTVGGGGDKDNKNQGSFKCEHCDRAFLFKNNLKAHLRTHTRDKKYTCELCGKSFIYKESLKNHMLLHSNELPYLCDICGKKFRDRSNRRKHVKNVHKYLFLNGDPLKPGATPAQPGTSGGQQTGEPPTKKRKTSKKAAAAAAAAEASAATLVQQDPQTGQQEGTSSSSVNANAKPRTIIKRGKKAKNATETSSDPTSAQQSVIVSNSTTTAGVDRKIIMSPCPKPLKSAAASSTMNSSPNSLDYIISHSHSSLPAPVHVPLAGGQGQFSHGRNIIVKASSASSASGGGPPNHHQSPPALSPEMYHHHSPHQPQQHSRGPASMQQNVIVYPKREKVISDHSQQYPSSSSVISQSMQQAHQHQYYVNHDQHHQPPPPPPQGYTYLSLTSQQPSPVQSSLMPPHISSPNPSAFEYVLGSSTNQQDGRGNDLPPPHHHHPYASSSSGPPSQPMEIQVVNQQEYSHPQHLYQDPLPYDQHYQWNAGGHPPHPQNPSSPYHLVAPPVGSNGSNSGLVNEGPPHAPPQVTLAQSYDSSGMVPTSNTSVYATAPPQGYEVLDPSGNGGSFFCKDFDFSYL